MITFVDVVMMLFILSMMVVMIRPMMMIMIRFCHDDCGECIRRWPW